MKNQYLYIIIVLVILVIVAVAWTFLNPVGAFVGNFDFSLSASPRIGTVGRSQSSTSTITAKLTKGKTQNVQLSLSGCPTATTCSLSRTSGNPTFTSILTVQTTSGTPLGSSIITVKGVGGGKTRSTTYALTVNPYCPDGVCESGETCSNCLQDCGACPPVCGNGICEAGETCSSCQQDCGCQSGYTCINSTCQQQCACGAWTNGACGGSCSSGYRQQTRTCTPSGCDITFQCIVDSSCVTNPDSCTDSDGGIIFTTRGAVSGYKSNYPYNYTDYCVGNSTLIEYWCYLATPLNYTYNCYTNMTSYCYNGVCA